MRCAATEMAFISWLLNKIPVLVCIIHMVAIGNKVAKVSGVFIALAFLTVFGVLRSHRYLPIRAVRTLGKTSGLSSSSRADPRALAF